MATLTISVRLDEETTRRVDAVAVALAENAQGARITRSNALRVIVDRGIDALESDLGLSKSRRKR